MWVNNNRTLWLDRNPDTWQLEVMSCDGAYCGNVVGQIVEPKQCLVRYFIIFAADQTRHFLLPSDSVHKIEGELYSAHTAKSLLRLPTYHHTVTERLERQIHAVLE